MSHDPVQNPYTAPSSEPGGGQSPFKGLATIDDCAKTNQIIGLALISGVTIITGIMLFMVITGADKDDDLFEIGEDLIFLVIGFGMFLVCTAMSFVVTSAMRRQFVENFRSTHGGSDTTIKDDESFQGSHQLLGGFSTSFIVGAALLEGSAVVNAIFLMLGDNLLHLIPVGLVVGLLLARLPSRARVRHFVENAVNGISS